NCKEPLSTTDDVPKTASSVYSKIDLRPGYHQLRQGRTRRAPEANLGIALEGGVVRQIL
ncbi:hypothetical protein Tco_1071388, partial [Tanacetum coccineum]